MIRNITRLPRFLFCFFFILVIPSFLFAQRTDEILLGNGDKITGEIKKMELGTLSYNTDDMGTLQIDWSKVKSIRSTNTFEIKLSSGLIHYASPDTTSNPEMVAIVTQFAPDYVASEVQKSEIVSLIRIKNITWSRFSGKYSLGIGLKKADNTSTLNFNADTEYRSRKIMSDLNLVSNRSKTESGTNNINQQINLSVFRIIKGYWFAGSSTSAEQNSELGLDLRILIGAVVGRYVVQNNLHQLLLGGGIQGTREWRADSDTENFLEGKLSANYKIFKFQHPKIDVSSGIVVYPGLSNWGRIRSDINANASLELFKDFFFGLNFYYKSDNQPAEGASKSDWGFNTSIGYTL